MIYWDGVPGELYEAIEWAEALEDISRDDLPADVEALARLVAHLDRLAKAVRHAKREVILRLHGAMPDKQVVIEGWGSLERKGRSRNVKWDDAMIAALVASRAVEDRWVDEVTGEIQRPEDAVRAAILDCAAISYWRQGRLKQHGLTPEQIDRGIVEVTYGDPGVQYWLAADPAREAVERMTAPPDEDAAA